MSDESDRCECGLPYQHSSLEVCVDELLRHIRKHRDRQEAYPFEPTRWDRELWSVLGGDEHE